MKVGRQVSGEIPQTIKSKPVNYTDSNINYQKKQNDSFGQETPPANDKIAPKSNPWSLKNITNVLGVVLGVGIVGGIALKMHFAPKQTKNLARTIKQENKFNAIKDDFIDHAEMAADKLQKGNWLYELGVKTKKLTDKHGEELINNLIYGVGTVIVMPLVILFSPIGKKDSSKEDKIFAVLRQPLSFITMFSMQATVDKVVKDLMPKLTNNNLLEDKTFKDGNKEKILVDNDGKLVKTADGLLKYPTQVNFNEKELKSHFENMLKLDKFINFKDEKGNKISLLNEGEIKSIFLFEDPKMINDKFDKIVEKKVLDNKELETTLKKEAKAILEATIKAKNRTKTLGTSMSIVSNVLISQAIGCTLLNVVYGKSMKQYQNYKKAKTAGSENGQTESVKGGN